MYVCRCVYKKSLWQGKGVEESSTFSVFENDGTTATKYIVGK